MRHLFGLMVLVSCAHACSSRYAYNEGETPTTTLGGPASPSERGRRAPIRLASDGVAKLERSDDPPRAVIHVRVTVSGAGSEPLVLDTRAQRLRLPDGRRISAAHRDSRAGAPRWIRIDPGSASTVDLYFPISEDLEASIPSRFDVVWRGRVGTDTVLEITPFNEATASEASVGTPVARQELAAGIVYAAAFLWGVPLPFWRTSLTGRPKWAR